MPDHESLQDNSTNNVQNKETMESPGGRDIVQTTVLRIEMLKSSTLMSRSDNPRGSTVRAPFVVAQALAKLTQQNWSEVADEMYSLPLDVMWRLR